MTKIEVFQAEGKPFVSNKPDPELGLDENAGTLRIHHFGTEISPQLFEAKFPPGGGVTVHAHLENEIIYVLEGEMHLGTHVLKAGDSVEIKGLSLYTFKAGPEGLHFLNFRGKSDYTYFTSAEIGAYKKLDEAGKAAMVEANIARAKKVGGLD